MKRLSILLYALFAYLAGLATLVYLLLWIYPWSFLPVTVDSAPLLPLAHSPFAAAALDLGLIALFGLQHSLMVRPGIKRWLDRLPRGTRRATYTLASTLALLLLLLLWQPLPQRLWNFSPSSFAGALALGLYLLGWSVAVIATFLIDHFELFGLHQAYRAWRKLPDPEPTFQERGFYCYLRHPIQAGTILGLWAAPSMSAGHLLLALGFTLYILIGLHFEERDLLRTLGEEYADYRRRVPMLIPFWWRKR